MLRAVGEVVIEGVRRIDTAARYGGDEFVVLLPETDPTGAYVLAEKIRLGVADLELGLADAVGPAVPVGRRRQLSRRRQHRRRADDQRRRRDVRQKRAGKNRVTGVDVPVDRQRWRPPRSPAHGSAASRCSIGAVADDDRTDRAARAPARLLDAGHPRRVAGAPGVDQRPTSVPIYQTATFSSADAQELGDVVADPRAGYAYSRIANPTTAALAAAYAELAGGEAGVALASGMGAIHAALASQLKAGDRVVAPLAIYGSTRTQLIDTFARFGVVVDFADLTDNAAAAAAIAAAPTRVVYAETIANPTTVVTDHAAIARLAHEHGATYIVDNTFASPYVCRPLELGADLVVESATKFLGGHSDVIAGVVAGRTELIERVEKVQIDTGATLGPFDAFLVLRGILTLAVRVERHAADRRGTRGAGSSVRTACNASSTRASRAIPSTPWRTRQFRPGAAAGCSRSSSPAGARRAGRSSTP